MYSYHILILPIAVVALVSGHVLLVRRNGVVPPFELESKLAATQPAAAPAAPETAGAAPSSTGGQS
jgi:ubiquinol-cytochrome c reductase cytochrome b subunit